MRRLSLVVAVAAATLSPAAAGCGGSSASSSSAPGPGAASAGGQHARAGAPARHVAALTTPAKPVSRSVRVPILTWHRVHLFATEITKSVPDLTVEPSVFSAEIEALASHGYHTITQLQLFDALFHGASLPSKPVLLTVDDGYVDDVTNILPVLRAHHLVATFYIITGRFHEPGFVNQTEVRTLDRAGMDIGAHTRTHVPLNAIPTADMKNQIIGSRNDLQGVLGHPVQWFAYPYGASSPAVVAEVHNAGFVLAVTTQGGTRETSTAPLSMPRIHVGRTQTAAGVLACMSATGGACGGGSG